MTSKNHSRNRYNIVFKALLVTMFFLAVIFVVSVILLRVIDSSDLKNSGISNAQLAEETSQSALIPLSPQSVNTTPTLLLPESTSGDLPSSTDPRLLVPTLSDLPMGFVLLPEYTGYWSNEQVAASKRNPKEHLARLQAWGRVNGYAVNYGRESWGISEVTFMAIVLKNSDGAHAYYEFIRSERLAEGNNEVSMPKLGDESSAFTHIVTDDTNPAIQWTEYDLMLRYKNILGSVYAIGRTGTFSFEDVFDLAQILLMRIKNPGHQASVGLPSVTAQAPARPTLTPTPVAIEQTQTLGPIWDSLHNETYSVEITLHRVQFLESGSLSGSGLVIVDVSVKNLGPGLMRSVSKSDFQVLDASGALHSPTWLSANNSCELRLVDLTAGGVISGCIGFEVPTSGRIELIYAPYHYESLQPGRYLSFVLRQ